MSCSESPAANSFLVDSLISSGRGEAGGGGAGGGGGGYYAHGGVYLPPATDLPYGLQSCGLFPALGSKRNEAASPSTGAGNGGLGPGAHGYAPAPIDLWLDAPRSSAHGQSLPRAAPRARLRPAASRASRGLGRRVREGGSPGRFATPHAGLWRWRRRGVAGRRGGARVVLRGGGAVPGPFREQQSVAGEGLPG
uniref:Homeobox protein A10 n=1 Tax=Jaculus jaculus TaxID=51337 RepID=A0A8C5P3L0_JACJA